MTGNQQLPESDNQQRLTELSGRTTPQPSAPQGQATSAAGLGNKQRVQGLQQPSTRGPHFTASPFATLPTVVPSAGSLAEPPAAARGRNWLAPGAAAALAFVVVITAMAVYVSGRVSGEAATAADTSPPSFTTPTTSAESGQDLGPEAFTAPVDIPGLINAVTASTVFLECDTGLGSGFLFDVGMLTASGTQVVVVTNDHVVSECEDLRSLQAKTKTASGQATVLATDPTLDLALVQLPGATGPSLALGANPERGQWVIAVGSPLGVEDSASFGYVTAYKPDESLITHDAVLGPGNSGGPLVDSQGRVIGVNSAVWEDANGISVAVPIRDLCVSLLKCSGSS